MPLAKIFRILPAIWRIIAIAAPIAFGIAIGQWISPWLPEFSRYVESLGAWAPFVFVVSYVLVVICLMPAFLLTMAGGAVFGPVVGTLLSLTGALIGGTCAFLIARHGAREFVARRIARNVTLASIDDSIGEKGGTIVFLLRLSPAVPFVLSNYALGITRVRLSHFVAGTLGFLPVVFAYAAFGAASVEDEQTSGISHMSPLLLGVGIIATALLMLLLGRITQRAMRRAKAARTASPSKSLVP